MRTLHRLASRVAAGVLGLVAATDMWSQTISPVIVEYNGEARGTLQVMNNTLSPLNVVLEPMSFTVDSSGTPVYGPLDSAVHLKLSSTSFRLGPRETYSVFYEASAMRLPAWFTVYATISDARRSSGIKIATRLPHTVYLLTKQRLTRDSLTVSPPAFTGKEVAAAVENRSQTLGRLQEVQVVSASGTKSYPGFPLFPGYRRALRLEWDRPEPPARVHLKFEKFEMAYEISPAAE